MLFLGYREMMSPLIPNIIDQKLKIFAGFKAGWHSGEGVIFNQDILDTTSYLNSEAARLGFIDIDVFPGLCGEVMLSFYYDEFVVDIIVENWKEVTYCVDQNDKEICYKEGLTPAEVVWLLIELKA